MERLVGFFAAFIDTDPRLYLGNGSMANGNVKGYPNMSQFDWNSTQSKSWNHTEKEKGEDYVDFFRSRLIVNFTLLVVDNDDSGLVVPRHSPVPIPGGHDFYVKEGEELRIPVKLSSKPRHPVFIQALSHSPRLTVLKNRFFVANETTTQRANNTMSGSSPGSTFLM